MLSSRSVFWYRPRVMPSVAVFCLTVMGCNSQKTYPVEGIVQFRDGKPAKELAGGFVNFEAVDGKLSAQGEIQADGTFRLGTFKPTDGAPPGPYHVTITPPAPEDPDRPPPPVMDRRFERLEKSGLEFTVKPEENKVTFRVDRARR